MKNINIKSKKGFTLIELLVVIGILAVLAAIAIPSVAGLIDRANVSSDNTNANEMTNAIERFASEYELYVQDIGSGALDPNNLDSAQGRVYNVTKATTRADITAIEKPQSVKVDDVGDEIAIYRDTKYPVNAYTTQLIVQNYTKTSSSTFEPKQSDCHYYYSPDCGLIVCTETDKASTTELNALVQSGKDAKGKDLGPDTQWIDITSFEGISNNVSTGNLIPDGAIYQSGNPSCEVCGFDFANDTCYCGQHTASEGMTECPNCQFDFNYCYCGSMTKDQVTPLVTYQGGDAFPETLKDGDVFKYNGYTYIYNRCYKSSDMPTTDTSMNGWSVKCSSNIVPASEILSEVNGKPVVNANYLFYGNTMITEMPEIPSTITSIESAFQSCTNLVDISNITKCTNVKSLYYTFANCTKITTVPDLASLNNLTNMYGTFWGCSALKTAPAIPNSVQSLAYTFSECSSLNDVSKITIPSSITTAEHMFSYCYSLTDASNLSFGGNISMNLTFCYTGLTDEGMPQLKDGIKYLSTTFGYCNNLINLKNYKLPSTVTSLQHTFTNSKNLQYAPDIPQNVTYMLQTYKGCSSLKESPVIPVKCTQVRNVFWGCTSLSTVVIDSTPTQYSGFLNDSSVTTVIKSDGSTHPLASALLATK